MTAGRARRLRPRGLGATAIGGGSGPLPEWDLEPAGRSLTAEGSDEESSQGGRHAPNSAPTVASSVLHHDIAGNEAQEPTAEMAVTPSSIRKSAPTTYAESSDAR